MTDFKLYDWQQEDVDKLALVRSRLIANEMGLGKTYQAGALDMTNVTDPSGNTLWVGPLGTLDGVEDKLHQMGHDAPIVRINPKNRTATWKAFKAKKGAIFLMHWEAVRLMPEMRELYWDHIIADEVHRIQGRKTQQTRALKRLKARFKTGLSGTPVTGAPDKYWSVLNWLYPNNFKSYWAFFKRYVEYEIVYPEGYHKVTGPANEEELLDTLDPFYVRHLKKEPCCERHPEGVAPWLPDKYYTTYWVDLLPQQRRAYDDMKRDMVAWVGAHEQSPLVASVAVAQLMRLQQFAVAFAQMSSENSVYLSEPSSKLDAVMQILSDNPNEPVVIWSQFKQLIYLLEARCKKAGIPILLYTGDNRKTRDQNVKAFANGAAQVFAGTISAGGVGVDGLQDASSTMIFMDRLWNPALNKQAEDRLWRDGQKNAVQIIDIMAHNTVDLGRKQRIEQTWSWIRTLLGDTRRVQSEVA